LLNKIVAGVQPSDVGGRLVMNLRAILVAGAAAAIAGTALAGTSSSHVMDVALPDGSVAHVEYVGNVPPKVTVAPVTVTRDAWMSGLPSFAGFDRMFEQMDRQMRQIEQMARQPTGTSGTAPGMNVASYGNLPAGADSVSVVSVSNGASSCTRTTEVVSQGPGKLPKITTNVSGNCGAESQPAPGAAPGRPIDHT
jgi:hypothetical protein